VPNAVIKYYTIEAVDSAHPVLKQHPHN